ncbi:disease resistance protein RPV1-like [Eucalyptus grandis]|uniref:disease resistance protein RPV1-like n=1 Tax=Eucalyptus grandis TaxID=71139 RepID=UPI00192E94BD|nr:disease resistance protein RPV1-like [Eucalyptus grandis]
MLHLIFEHSFAELVALILLPGLTLYFLNKKRASARGNAEDVDTGASGSMAAPMETNSDGSSPSPTKANNGASSSMAAPTETNSDGSSPSLTKANNGASSSMAAPTKTNSDGSSLSPTKANNGASSSMATPTETNSDGSNPSPTKAHNGASSSMAAPTETNSDGSSPSPTKANNGASSSMAAPTETNSDGSSPSPTKANNGATSLMTGNCYEVFLSFRGSDTRHGFTDHLYKGLVDAGIDTFRDDDELCHGEDIKLVLEKAITSSKILIPIFSVNYGTSSWCLNELVKMMEPKKNNGQIVLPIFYKVKPADVRHQIGSFGEAFHRRVKRLLGRSSLDAVTLEEWKSALGKVSTLKGYEALGSEVELVKSIIRKVLNELKKKFKLDISKNLVGIDVHEKKVMEFVDNKSHDTLFVGIHGMGGIGKTTLAKAIYNRLFDQFEHRSFIADIRESWKRNGVHYLQNQLIYDILKLKDELKSLAGNHDWFSSGSKIIITTRDKRVLEEAGVDHDYEHKEMDENQSLILFSKHAFRRDSPPREFEDLTHEVVSITGGLPLSLEVFGSLLCGKKKAFWEGTIGKLRKVPPKKVQEKLKISIEALDDNQKQIFLDIACFFIDYDKDITSYMWDACGFFPKEGIEVLIFMSLIKVGNDNELKMHDQLRDLGRDIVCEENRQKPWCRGRLWEHKEARKMLEENKGTDNIEAINLSDRSSEYLNEICGLDGDDQDGGTYEGKQFENLRNLRFLDMTKTHLIGDFKNSMTRLKWLDWKKCPASFEAKNFHVVELVTLGLDESEINEKWKGWSFFKMAEGLKYLNLYSCTLLEDTDFLSAFKKLEVLILNGCKGLKRIDASIGDMEALIRLELYDCESLTELPAEIGNLKAPQQLGLIATSSLSALPDRIDRLENLEILEISYSGIEELPNGEDHGVETGVFANDGHRELEGGASPLLLAEVVDSLLVIASKREGQVSKMSYMHYCARKLLQFGGFGDSEYL